MTNKFLLPNVKKLDYPLTKKNRVTPPAPEVYVAVNIAPMEGAALQGSYVISESLIPQSGTVSAPGPSHPEEVSHIAAQNESCSALAPRSVGCRVYILESRKMLMLTLLDCTHTGRLPSIYQLLTLMDIDEPVVDTHYIDA